MTEGSKKLMDLGFRLVASSETHIVYSNGFTSIVFNLEPKTCNFIHGDMNAKRHEAVGAKMKEFGWYDD